MAALALFDFPQFGAGPPIAPLNLTFGVEIECYQRFPTGKYGANFASIFSNSLLALQATLKRAGVPTEVVEISDPEPAKDYSTWLIEDEPSLEAYTDEGGVETTRAEIISRVLPHGAAGAAEVSTALRALHAEHALTAGDDGRAGLHVHVGAGGTALPLRTVKNLALLTTAFEPAIYALVGAQRHRSRYCLPPSRFRLLFLKDQSLAWHLQSLAEARTLPELLQLTASGDANWQRFMGLNLLGLRKPAPRATVEFRYFAGTTDPDEVLLWVDVAAGLVALAHGAGDAGPRARALLDRFGDPAFAVADFVEAVGGRALSERFAALARRSAQALPGGAGSVAREASPGRSGGLSWSPEALGFRASRSSLGSLGSMGSMDSAPGRSRRKS